MNTNIKQLYDFALLQIVAESYFDGVNWKSPAVIEGALRRGNNRSPFDEATAGASRLTEKQIAEFLSRYTIVDSFSDDPRAGPRVLNGIRMNTGFAAVLIQKNGTNDFYLAIRSTEDKEWAKGGDRERDELGEDLLIGVSGFGWPQLDTMEQYYKWLKSSGTLPAGAHLDVAGYSLAGHLATVFTELHKNDPAIVFGETITFNAPGRGTGTGSIDEMLSFYRQVLADPDAYVPPFIPSLALSAYLSARAMKGQPQPDLSIYWDPRHIWAQMATQIKYLTVGAVLQPRTLDRGRLENGAGEVITAVYGRSYQDNTNAVAGLGVHGEMTGVFIEAQPNLAGVPDVFPFRGRGDYGGSHAIVLIADSLAVMRLLNGFDPRSDIESLNRLFQSASSRTTSIAFTGDGSNSRAEWDALENVLDAVRRMLLSPSAPRTEYGVGARGFGDLTKRNVFYDNLDAVAQQANLEPLKGRIVVQPLAYNSVRFLAGSAKVDFADHLALQMLSPFTLKPKASDAEAESLLRTVWSDVHVDSFAAWSADLLVTNAQRATGAAAFTNDWYRDRATMLQWVLKANENDIDHAANGGFLLDKTIADPVAYSDVLTETAFTVSAQNLPAGTKGIARVTFGASGDDTLTGADASDHLYGGGGTDTLRGFEGNDLLEGNDGIDVLDGGVGEDDLLGGNGDDTLLGGANDDTLRGGAGFDRYVIQAGQGFDTIIDSDGKGWLDWDGVAVTGGYKVDTNFWMDDQGFTYTLNADRGVDTLYVERLGRTGRVAIENFSPTNNLSIVFTDAPRTSLPPDSVRNIQGDLQILDTDPVSPGVQYALDDIGNQVRSPVPDPGRADFFVDSPGNDLVQLGGGADYIKAFAGGNDTIRAGDGVDGVSAGDGNDWIEGGAGADELAGGNGSDKIFGGDGDDVIMTEHDFSTDTATWRLAMGPGVEQVRWWSYDGRFEASGFGISVVRYTFEGITFETPWVGIYAWKEHHDPAATDFVDAGDGADLVYGGEGADLIFGGAGSDRIEGSAGSDNLFGGDGNDQIMGDSPVLTGLVSSRPPAMDGDDRLFGGAGDDLLMGGNGSDLLAGGDGNDVLYGDLNGVYPSLPPGVPALSSMSTSSPADDVLLGGAGNDRLHGERGDDLLIGGAGDDELTGGSGADVYHYDRGDGADTVLGAAFGDGDELRLGAGIDANHAVLSKVDGNLILDTGAPGDVITLKDWFIPRVEAQVSSISFADGTVWSRDAINASFVVRQDGTDQADTLWGVQGGDQIYGLGGADSVSAGNGDDLIVGGAGNDVLDGGAGSDRYVFVAGDGADRILGYEPVGNDVLQFVGIRRDGATFARSGNALTITANGGADSVTIPRYFETFSSMARSASAVQTIEFEGGVQMSFADVRALFQTPVVGTAGNDYFWNAVSVDQFIDAGAGNDTAIGGLGNDTLLGGDGDDRLDGRVGADVLDGGPGNDLLLSQAEAVSYYPTTTYRSNDQDTFVFGRGYGHDVIDEYDPVPVPSEDTVFLKALRPADVAFGRGDGSGWGDEALIIRVRDTGDTLQVLRFFSPDAPAWVERFVFADGTVLKRDDVMNFLTADGSPTSAGDYLLGGPGDDAIDGGLGNDILWLGDGNDIGFGGPGDDRVQGGGGSNYLAGDAGNDLLFGGAGADTLDGGPGDDVLSGADVRPGTPVASDLYIFGRGYGRDRIIDSTSSGTADTLFLQGLGPDDVEVGWSRFNALRVRVLDTGDELLVENQFDGHSNNKVEEIVFADGTRYDAARLDALARANRDDYVTGTAAADVIDGGHGDDTLFGGGGNDRLVGGAGHDSLDGQAGADTMEGGAGNDTFAVDNIGDVVVEGTGEGRDAVSASIAYTLPANVEDLSLGGSTAIAGTGNELDNRLTGNSAANRLAGGAGNDVLDGRAGGDTMLGGAGDDTYYVDSTLDVVTENANEGNDTVVSTLTRTLGGNQEHLTLSGSSTINGTGNGLNNRITGNAANNVLNGAAGTDVLQGAAGNDALSDTSGRGVQDGGDGADALTGGTDRQFFAGGTGSDTITPGGGADVIAFNRGDGADTVVAPAVGAGAGERNDTISLGGVGYGDLRLARDATDLVVNVAGTPDSLRLKGWYASAGNQTVNALQLLVDTAADYDATSSDVLRDKRIVRLDFGAIVAAFDAAGSPAGWTIPPATLALAYVAGSDTTALGGQLAYRYGEDRSLAGLDFATMVGALNDVGFGTVAQSMGAGAPAGGAPLLPRASVLAGRTAVTASTAAPLDWVQAKPVDAIVVPDDPAMERRWAVATQESSSYGDEINGSSSIGGYFEVDVATLVARDAAVHLDRRVLR